MKIYGNIDKLAPELVFLIFGVVFGVLMVFLSPINFAPDEMAHFSTAYVYANGRWDLLKRTPISAEYVNAFEDRVYVRGKVSKAAILEGLRHPFGADNRGNEKVLAYTTQYFPINYLPQVTGLVLAKLVGFSPLYRFYFGRLFNLAAWILLVYFSIRIIPFGKWILAAIALTPMSVFLAASFSADPVITGVSFLFLSTLLYYFNNSRPARSEALILTLSATLMAVFKGGVLFPLLMLLILIPSDRFTGRLSKAAFIVMVTGISGILLFLWSSYTNSHGYSAAPPWVVNPRDQLVGILQNPLGYAGVCFNTMKIYGVEYCRMLVGVLGWLDTYLPDYIYWLYLILAMLALWCGSQNSNLQWKQRAAFFCLFLVEFLAILSTIYLTWTAVGGQVVLGVQGRYFLPIIGLLLVAIHPDLPDRGRLYEGSFFRSLPIFLTTGMGISLVFAVMAIVGHNYLWQNIPFLAFLNKF